tara:strand:+ start:10610 stop:11545 length:936 start_codon:yes stop_codon:yes gene_type:complete
MSVTIYGIDSEDYKARPDFTARRDGKGAWSATNSFSMLRTTWEESAREEFKKGVDITQLYPELNEYWSFLKLEEVDLQTQPGGWVQAQCTWGGWTETDYSEDEDVVYTLSGTRVERSILLHPLFIHETGLCEDLFLFIEAYHGLWTINPNKPFSHEEVTFQRTSDLSREWQITSTGGTSNQDQAYRDLLKWAEVIFKQGIRTYKAPTLQWTQEKSSAFGWKMEDLTYLGLSEHTINDNPPPGNPPHPPAAWWEWMKISMNQTLEAGRAIQSQTWELSPPNGFHRFQGEQMIGGKGIYNWELSDLEIKDEGE